MEIHQLKTFLAVARVGSITRAAGQLHLSQPAVSAQIKALEDALGLRLFERTSRGMELTERGRGLRPTAEGAVAAHADVLAEAARLNGELCGRLRLGLGANSEPTVAGELVAALAERHGGVRVSVSEGDSAAIVEDLVAGQIDAGFFNVSGAVDPRLLTVEVAGFELQVVAPVGTGGRSDSLDWHALAAMTWICPPESSCCGRAVRALFRRHGVHPARIIEVDRESSTRTLVAAGTGVGLLHAYTAAAAVAQGEIEVLCDVGHTMRVLLGILRSRDEEPLLRAVLQLAEG